MMRLLIAITIVVLSISAGPAKAADEALKLALKQAVEDSRNFQDPYKARVWLTDMSKRLEAVIPDPFYRLELLKIIHNEATRAGLEPELVLALVQVESAFDRFAISTYGARGLMQVMPFWKKEIGHPRDNLFHPRTNLRYGCTILKYYLDHERGNLFRALARYNGSVGKSRYPRRVLTAKRTRWYRQ